MIIENIANKGQIDYKLVNYWSNSIKLMRMLKKEDDLYLDEFYLLSLVYRIFTNKGSTVTQEEIVKEFNILSYKREKMVLNLISRGYIKDDQEEMKRGHFKPHKYTVTPLGEQILIKYQRAMVQFCEGSK
jgi:predicted transcriptional regulator